MASTKERRIRSHALFRHCSASEIEWIASVADELDITAGSTLARAGEVSAEFVVLLDGTAAAGDVILGPGSFFGDAGLLDDAPNARTITSRSEALVLVFNRRAFRSLVTHVPSAAKALAAATARSDYTEPRLRAVS